MTAEATEHAPFAPDFRVGDWLVEPSLDRLSRNGTVVRLRPQLTNLLVLLAEHAGRTVSKDEILARVWEGHFVAESGMTRCVAEIRQAFEDDAREPKILETIPKRGYRLVAPVVFLEEGIRLKGDSTKPEPTSAGEAHIQLPEPNSTGEGQIRLEADSTTATTTDEGQTRRERDFTTPLGPALRWTARVFVGGTVVLGLAWGAIGWSHAPVLSERDSVLLADVANTTGDPAFDQTLRLALAVNLGQAPFLRLVPTDQMRMGLVRMGRPADQPVTGAAALELCRREGAAVLLAGSIARLGSHYAVGIEAVACGSGESIGRQLVEVESKDRVLSALGTAAGRIRRALGESRASLQRHDVPIVEATTPSLEALKALSLGDLNRDHARFGDALAFYRRATELDPNFAVAWARRGAAARNAGFSAGEQRFGTMDEPTYAFSQAYQLRERVSEQERFYILGHYYRFVANDPGKAVETYEMWKRTYPGATIPVTNLASILVHVYGAYDAALPHALEAVRLAPDSSIAIGTLVMSYMGAGRLADAQRVLHTAEQRGVADSYCHQLAAEVALAQGNLGLMEEHARRGSVDPTTSVAMDRLRAVAAAAGGRMREALRLESSTATVAGQLGLTAGKAAMKLDEAEGEALLGDRRAARAAAEEALSLDRQPATLWFAGFIFAFVGDHPAATRIFAEAGGSAAPGICSKYVWRPLGQALTDAASGRTDRALQTLRQVAPFERGRDFGLAPLAVRGSIELAAGRPREAAAAFREAVRLHTASPLSPWVLYARLGLGRALAGVGDQQGSVAAYDDLLAALKNADPDLPLLAAARGERAQALTAANAGARTSSASSGSGGRS